MSRLTLVEAIEFIEDVCDCPLDLANGQTVEAFLFERPPDRVRSDLESFVAGLDREIDMGSVQINEDRHESGLQCSHIIIKTEAQA
jgi:hypothetical protein